MSKCKKISMSEFKKMFEESKEYLFAYDSSTDKIINKASNRFITADRSMRIIFFFDEVITMLAPDRICFKSGKNTITFDIVKEIAVEDNDFYSVLYITCASNGEITKYTVVVDRKKDHIEYRKARDNEPQ